MSTQLSVSQGQGFWQGLTSVLSRALAGLAQAARLLFGLALLAGAFAMGLLLAAVLLLRAAFARGHRPSPVGAARQAPRRPRAPVGDVVDIEARDIGPGRQ